MSKIRVTINIDSDINDRWAKVAKKHKLTKSGIVQEFLESALPILEIEKPTDAVSAMFKEMGKTVEDVGSLFHEK